MFKLGTRKSLLARTQTAWVKEKLERLGLSIEVIESEAIGDKDGNTPLYEMELETPGIFTKQLEDLLLSGKIDFAVHSLKDLPTQQPEGLFVSCIPKRESTQEYLFVHKDYFSANEPLNLKQGTAVGTSSLRRKNYR